MPLTISVPNYYVEDYDSLWENEAPMEKIVDFCRRYQQEVVAQRGNIPKTELLGILLRSYRWGHMVFMPSFLKHLTDEDDKFLIVLGDFFQCYISLQKRLQHAARILSMGDRLPEKIRAFFWLLSTENNRPYFDTFHTFCNDIHLVDNINACMTIITRRSPHYDLIPAGFYFLVGRQGKRSERLDEAILNDSVSRFEMEMTLSGKILKIGIVRAILLQEAFQLLVHLLKHHNKKLTAILSPEDILICVCAWCTKYSKALVVLNTLEELYPGICKKTDRLGNNPLWYCLNKRYHGYPSENEEFIQTLIRYGCDPEQRNHLGLSYRICTEVRKRFGL